MSIDSFGRCGGVPLTFVKWNRAKRQEKYFYYLLINFYLFIFITYLLFIYLNIFFKHMGRCMFGECSRLSVQIVCRNILINSKSNST